MWWIKLGLALILSNIFFFVLFKSDPTPAKEAPLDVGWVELQIRAELLTPFERGKKILLIHRASRSRSEAIMEAPIDAEGRMTIRIHETEASHLFKHEAWEVFPYMKTLSFAPIHRGESYEIRY